MGITNEEITKRILALTKKGWTDAEIAERLTADGVTNEKGGHFTKNAVRSRRERARKSRPPVKSDTTDTSDIKDASVSASSEADTSAASEASPPVPSDISEPSDISLDISEKPDMSEITGQPLPEQWKRQIVQIIQAEIGRMMQSVQTLPKHQTEQAVSTEIIDRPLPPEPKKIPGPKSKPIALGSRVKIAGTCDARLYTLFEQWRSKRGITLSRALDAALWHFLGQPDLSFQIKSEESEGSDDES